MRHAVVIIHGIGEQKPMDTLRGFVSTITHKPDGDNSADIKFYNKPDNLSTLFELRRLTTASSEAEDRIKTDFFEYYWAYNIRDTKAQQVLKWIGGIIFRWPGSLPKRIRFLHIGMWVLLLASAFLFIGGFNISFLKENQPVWLGSIGTLLSGFLGYLLTQYVGDAARYTSANPGNIAERQRIRQEGVMLLKSLTNSGKYEKIILVGHSLGSIIGYDLIKHLWSDYNTLYEDKIYAKDLQEFEKKYANPVDGTFNINNYRADQEALFYQQNNDGNPWKISHFITLGSPLTHASFLLAKDLDELKQRVEERELPTAPPTFEVFNNENRITYRPDVKNPRRVLHHAAPFACTQWINVYYKNDFVGGSLSEYFGHGIEQHAINIQKSFFHRWIPFLSHTHYWSDNTKDFGKCEESARILKNIIWK